MRAASVSDGLHAGDALDRLIALERGGLLGIPEHFMSCGMIYAYTYTHKICCCFREIFISLNGLC
jgi:hypothetical protein